MKPLVLPFLQKMNLTKKVSENLEKSKKFIDVILKYHPLDTRPYTSYGGSTNGRKSVHKIFTEDGKFKGFIITTHETIEDLWDGRPSLHRDYTNEIKIEEIKNWVPAIIEDIDQTVKFLTNVKNMKDHNDIIKNVKKSWSISEEISNFLKEIEVLPCVT